MPLTILADDLTGACDTGTLFARDGVVPATVWPSAAPDARVRVVDTESRSLPGAAAAARVRSAAEQSPSRRWFKKIDSTLRGRIGAEIDALVDVLGVATALVTPAFPSEGRVVTDRVLYVHGVPVTATAVADDPDFPRAFGGRARTASVIDILRAQVERPIAWIPLREARAGTDELASRLARLTGTIVIADAETDADLENIVDAALAASPSPLLAGSAGLARALAHRVGLLAAPVEVPRGCRWLVVVGSRHPVARRQAASARDAGLRVLSTPEADDGDRVAPAARIAEDARRIMTDDRVDLVAVTGGETALALYRTLGAERIDLVGAPRPGLALGRLQTPAFGSPWLLTKAGGFGAPGLFAELAKEAA